MHVVRRKAAVPYDAPGHYDMTTAYLQGRGAGPNASFWTALSTIEPGGYTDLKPSEMEKVYIVLSGQVHFENGDEGEDLNPLDSVRFSPGESRALTNRGSEQATVLLIMEEPR